MKKKKQILAEAGNAGAGIRSDCHVSLELTTSDGIDFKLKSKVKTMYGKSIEKLCMDVLKKFEIKNARMIVNDSGALPFVISARLEAAIKQLVETESEYLPKIISENKDVTAKERFRFSRLYLPGNSPGLMINAGVHNPNGVILDLEDSVAPAKKEEARYLVRNALRQVNFYGAERMVRINQFPDGLKDLKFIVPHNVHMILVPKCEGAEQIEAIEKEIDAIKKASGTKKERFIYFKC